MIGKYRIIRSINNSFTSCYRYKAQHLRWGLYWKTISELGHIYPVIPLHIKEALESNIKAHAILNNGKEVQRYSFDHELFKELSHEV